MAQKESIWLVPIAGPALAALQLLSKPGGIVVGRHERSDVRMPADAEKVSRAHARFLSDAGEWRVVDLNSRWGTFVNGVRLVPGREMPLRENDLIRLTPWTFTVSNSGEARNGLQSSDDNAEMKTLIRAVRPETAAPVSEELLALLLETAAGIHAATDEKALAELLLDAAMRGTRLPNAALLRPLDSVRGRVEVIASRVAPMGGGILYSRSLLEAASSGNLVEIGGSNLAQNTSESIVQAKITTALCVPLMLGSSPAAYLYLDARAVIGPRTGGALHTGASAFCLALARMAGLALANLKRIDIERRQAMIEAELNAGAEAQRWIMPRRLTEHPPFRVIGQSRPGAYVGGDFFDVLSLDDHRLAVAVGDVCGHGVAASVLMTAAQGFLHAALRRHERLDQTVRELNQFVVPRRPEHKFLTLWVGIFDLGAMTLTYVDAGHGYALGLEPAGEQRMYNEGGGFAIGMVEDSDYEATVVAIQPGGRCLIVSDGIIEQFSPPMAGAADASPEQFSLARLRQTLERLGPDQDVVESVFQGVFAHAGTQALSDDATAVLVKW